MFIQPLLAPTWWYVLEKELNQKHLEGIIEILLAESILRNPVHGKRMHLLGVNNNGPSHYNFLMALEEQLSLANYKNMSLPNTPIPRISKPDGGKNGNRNLGCKTEGCC